MFTSPVMAKRSRLYAHEKRSINYFQSPCIEVLVGDHHQRSFYVHKNLLTSHSPFFANSLSNSWKENEERIVRLPKDDPEVFDLYVQYLYQGIIPVREDVGHSPPKHDHRRKDSRATRGEIAITVQKIAAREWNKLCHLYVLAEKLQDTWTKKDIISAVVEATMTQREDGQFHFPVGENVNVVYEGTMPGDAMRRLLVDFFVFKGGPAWVDGGGSHSEDEERGDSVWGGGEEHGEELNTEFYKDVMMRMWEVRKPKDCVTDVPIFLELEKC